jgi:hypothetical protein
VKGWNGINTKFVVLEPMEGYGIENTPSWLFSLERRSIRILLWFGELPLVQNLVPILDVY